ncbi:MAG: AAA family ATPase [Pseudomonadota bacterium]
MIKDYLRAGYPALFMLTQEPYRTQQLLTCDGWRFMSWDCIQGIRDIKENSPLDEIRDPVEAIKWLSCCTDTVLIAHNLHLFLEVPEVIQAIQNGVIKWKGTGCALILVAPSVKFPLELEKLFHVIDIPLPGYNSLFSLQQDMGQSLNVAPDEASAFGARGLTEFEAETAFALSLVRTGKFSPKVISEAKGQMIRKSGLMQLWEPADIEDVGGLDALKAFISNRAKAYDGLSTLPKPKGILLVGIPGTGKSLSCKATASLLGWPLIRLDIGALKGSLVGESERRMRDATQTINAFGNAVIWIDELEKAFAGAKSSGETDGGTTSAMFGYFLTWLQETTAPILVMATANNISQLPPEFIRSGRFDAIFFVDLPQINERRQIIEIVNRKWNSDIPAEFAERLNGYTGAEIEQIAKDSLFDGIETAINSLIPLSRIMKEDINALRDWARNRARTANTPEEVPEQRKIRRAE